MNLYEAKGGIHEAHHTIMQSIDCSMMDAPNMSDIILSYAKPTDLIIHLSLGNKTHTFNYRTFCKLLQTKLDLLQDIISSTSSKLVIEDRMRTNTKGVFHSSFDYTDFEEFISFFNRIYTW